MNEKLLKIGYCIIKKTSNEDFSDFDSESEMKEDNKNHKKILKTLIEYNLPEECEKIKYLVESKKYFDDYPVEDKDEILEKINSLHIAMRKLYFHIKWGV